MKALPIEQAILRPHANLRVAASTSFREEGVNALSALLAAVRSGRDTRAMQRSAALTNIERKVLHMRATIARQHERRVAKRRAETGA